MHTPCITHPWHRLAGMAISALLLATLQILPAHAVQTDGLFKLDGKTNDPSGAALPDDWESFTNNTANTTRATGIVADTKPAVFRNGSKDTLDISSWRYDLGSSPPKDDMLHGYAAAYTATTTTATTSAGDLIIYFGADRSTFTGTASLGFWFFKNPIARNDASGSFVVPGTSTPARHATGDILVAFEYTNGGAVTSVRLYEWIGNGTSGSLVDKGTIGVSATNVPSLFCNASDTVCGATNNTGITIPWVGAIQSGQFFEGGINITKALPGVDNCFAGFMATSRTSSTATASIKNFILAPSFPVCHLSVTKQCPSSTFQAANNTFLNTIQGKILNDGGGPLSTISLVDNPAVDAGTLGFFTCDASGQPTTTPQSPATLATGAAICYRARTTSNANGASDTVTVTASTGTGAISGTASATCPQIFPATGLSLSKTCDVDLVAQNNQLALKVNYSGTVTNTGEVSLSNVKVCEAHETVIGSGQTPCDVTHTDITIGTLAAGETRSFSGTYFPSKAVTGAGGSALTTPELAVFKDQVGAVGNKPAIFGGQAVVAPAVEASCPLCH